jgi:hypothetical protein
MCILQEVCPTKGRNWCPLSRFIKHLFWFVLVAIADRVCLPFRMDALCYLAWNNDGQAQSRGQGRAGSTLVVRQRGRVLVVCGMVWPLRSASVPSWTDSLNCDKLLDEIAATLLYTWFPFWCVLDANCVVGQCHTAGLFSPFASLLKRWCVLLLNGILAIWGED